MKIVRLKQEKLVDLTVINSDSLYIGSKQYKLSFSIYSSHPTDPKVAAIEQNKAFQKIMYMIEDILGGSIVYDFKNRKLVDKFFADYENNFITLPYVSEILLAEALHCKFNALCSEFTHVDSIELIDTFTGLSYMFLAEEEEDYMLPSQQDFVGDFPFFETPWWNRYDTTTFDNSAEDEEAYENWKTNFKTDDFDRMTVIVLQEIDEAMEKEFKESAGEVVSLEDFKEKIKEKEKWKPRLV